MSLMMATKASCNTKVRTRPLSSLIVPLPLGGFQKNREENNSSAGNGVDPPKEAMGMLSNVANVTLKFNLGVQGIEVRSTLVP